MQASNFGDMTCTFNQLVLRIFYEIFTEDASQTLLFLYHGAKKVKDDQKLKSRGGGSEIFSCFIMSPGRAARLVKEGRKCVRYHNVLLGCSGFQGATEETEMFLSKYVVKRPG